jgi:hypothetical protein
MDEKVSRQLFGLDQNIRYVAVNQKGRIIEMEQNQKWPSYNPAETDRIEELIVNPVILDLAKRRGDLDLNGIRYVVIRYGLQYQLIFPYEEGHISIGVELKANITDVAQKVAKNLSLSV